MSRPITKVQHPPVNALLSVDGARRALARLVCEAKLGLIEVDTASRLGNLIAILINSAKTNVFEARLDRLESRLDQADGDPTMPSTDGGYRQRLQ